MNTYSVPGKFAAGQTGLWADYNRQVGDGEKGALPAMLAVCDPK